MKKKLLLIVLAFVCALTCALSLAACNNDDDNKNNNPYAITQTEWGNQITSNAFIIVSNSENLNGNDLMQLTYNGNAYQCLTRDTVFSAPLYVKEKNGNDYTYLKYETQKSDDRQEIETTITAEEYSSNVSAYIELIDYVNKNYSAFTFYDTAKDHTDGYSHYFCDIDDMESKTTKVKDLNITDIAIRKDFGLSDTDNIIIEFTVGERIDYNIRFKSPVLLFDKAFDTLTNYTLKGGPSTTDADYAEYYFNESGFRMYTPNNPEPTRRDGYYKYNPEIDNYTQYIRQADGSYVTAQVSKNALQTVIDGVHDTYMYFETQRNSFYKTADGMKNSKEITKTVGQRVHHFYDIDIKTDENGKITSITWKYKITQGEQSTQEYNMELTAGNTTIEFPNA